MNQPRPDTQKILHGLKDFQRDTVEHVFRRLYLDDDCVHRFLVADEVGLGKTLVARGLIAKAIDHLWEKTERIDIVYVCSNADIARQNIQRLNVTGRKDVSHASRITLLPIKLPKMDSRLNFVSFTPGTSFDLKSSGGIAEERALLFWMLRDAWGLDEPISSRPFEGWSKKEGFQYWLNRVGEQFDQGQIHREMTEAFVSAVGRINELRSRYDEMIKEMVLLQEIPEALSRQCLDWVGELRRILAETCLRWLEPDLIILDEFQRFKDLLRGDSENASHAAQLAEHLFSFQEDADDPRTAARVLLLSATPYKMYTQSQESENDDHYQDFQTTLDFLLQDPGKRVQFHDRLLDYREELFRLADHGVEELTKVKNHLERCLRDVMVRTERLALKSDRNGMLVEVPSMNVTLKSSDVAHYVGLQRVAQHLGHADVLEYWKSAPYLLNFMEDYDFKRKLKNSVEEGPDSELAKRVRSIGSGLLDRGDLERYRRLDPANARLRSIYHDTIAREAWRLLWIPPSMPYYEGSGPFVDPALQGFTKRLVFSSWRVAPKAIASVLSYEAERCMMQTFRRKVQNTAEARKRRRGLLRFTFSQGRPTGMPVLGMLYPCQTLADQLDPLQIAAEIKKTGNAVTEASVKAHCVERVDQLIEPLKAHSSIAGDAVDERWYWAASLLLDLRYKSAATEKWIKQKDLAANWSGGTEAGDKRAAAGWARHVELAKELVFGEERLGRPPDDLCQVLSLMAIAGPGVVSLRALERVLSRQPVGENTDLRSFAGPLAHSFLHLFNLPEVLYLLRDRSKDKPYWQSVLNYCVAGNLQSVVDEYCHILLESLGLMEAKRERAAAEICKVISDSLSIRTSTAKADVITTNRVRVQIDDDNAIRMRTRFAMRFADQDSEDGSEGTRKDHVRAAFNSPFWPFVLATTSVGQEGLDFHPYCHAVVHWNLPSNPVDLEQREGRVHRYKGHALRKNIASSFSSGLGSGETDPWSAMFDAARSGRPDDENDLFPFWVAPKGKAKIERHVPALPHSREVIQKASLARSLVLYRMVFGQNRQEDLIEYLSTHLPKDKVDEIVQLCRIDLSPHRKSGHN